LKSKYLVLSNLISYCLVQYSIRDFHRPERHFNVIKLFPRQAVLTGAILVCQKRVWGCIRWRGDWV